MSSGEGAKKTKSSGAKKSPQELIDGFNALRAEQRQIASKIFELESDQQEHKIVAENLKTVDSDRKCYRMIGGVLIERTVKDVLPDLISNADQLKLAIEGLNGKLIEKGKEIVEYKEKNNIQFQVPDKIMEEDESAAEAENTPSSGLLVGGKR